MSEHPFTDMPPLRKGDRVGFTMADGEIRTEVVKAVREDKETGEVELEFE